MSKCLLQSLAWSSCPGEDNSPPDRTAAPFLGTVSSYITHSKLLGPRQNNRVSWHGTQARGRRRRTIEQGSQEADSGPLHPHKTKTLILYLSRNPKCTPSSLMFNNKVSWSENMNKCVHELTRRSHPQGNPTCR